MAMRSIEQERAAHAWKCAQEKVCNKEYVNLAKGLPALVMNSGLLQVMAYLEDKGKDHHQALGAHLRGWLAERFKIESDFKPFMEKLMGFDSQRFQNVTEEAFAWLKWLRLMAAAQVKGDGQPNPPAGRN